MHKDYTVSIGHQLSISPTNVKEVIRLFDRGATVPFIARYRKEQTGSLDEVAILAIKNLRDTSKEIDSRRDAIVSSLSKNGLLSDTLLIQLNEARSLSTLEDLYLPYRPKRRTRAAIARERNLLPLAQQLFLQGPSAIEIEPFLCKHNGVNTREDALAGAADIIAEIISEDQQTRKELRIIFRKHAQIRSRVVPRNKEKAVKFRDYFDWREPVARIAGHRLLALYRGESAGFLRLTVKPDVQLALTYLYRRHLKPSVHRDLIKHAIEDGYRRLLAPSLENDIKSELKSAADKEAISVFSNNLRELLLAAPFGEKRVMALDPGYRTGAKLACLDAQGQYLHSTTIFPTHGHVQQARAGKSILNLIKKYDIQAIAIGSGTASRETEQFIRKLDLPAEPVITLVNEDGASVYSASESARNEFPDLDITVRGAISIGRRLQDPLAELVKIDPKSIGVGQYQHDVDQAALKKGLAEVVESCVNSVGVEVNSASAELLSHVSGLGPALAQNIVLWRIKNGPFKNRADLLKVPRFGARAFELAAGFLRIQGSDNPLDTSGVHPERYDLVKRIADDLKTTVEMLLESRELRKNIQIKNYISEEIGLPTLEDIMSELDQPGRDPRTRFRQFRYAENVLSIEDLQPGMKLPAIITNVTRFGAFADIGIHQDGLIHISQLADRFVGDPAEVVTVRQHVQVRVLSVDIDRKRISLSLKSG